MKNIACILSGLIISAFVSAVYAYNKEPDKQGLRLWYNQPSQAWEEALPLGNGRIGTMVFGDPINELFQLNENSLWSGAPQDGNNPQALPNLQAIRNAINSGEYKKAADLWKRNAQGPYSARYLPLADLHLEMQGIGEVRNYYRDLNLSTALSSVVFESNDVKYKRTCFISHPDQVLVVQIEADKKESLSFNISLDSPLRHSIRKTHENTLALRGKAPKYVAHRKSEAQQIAYDNNDGEGMNFEVHVKVMIDGGKLIAENGLLSVKKANVATLILSAATSFNGFNKSPGLDGKNPETIASTHLHHGIKKAYKELLESHITDYQSLFNKVEFELGGAYEAAKLPTRERIKSFENNDTDNGLVVLYFQFGRYLTIASSRQGGGIPSNLQGLWNRFIQAPWGSNYTTNINTEMNYWPAEPAGLPECHLPLLEFINSLSINGQQTALINYGIPKGWVAHHNSDLWAQSAPAGNFDLDMASSAPKWSCWPMAGAWFSRHLWEHYIYGGDRKYLSEKAYPLMKGAAEFILGWLQKDESGYWITNPSSSPENVFSYIDKNGQKQIGEISKASTMDIALIWDLFTNCIQAANTLKTDGDFVRQLEKVKKHLYPHRLGLKGQLLEWFADFEEPEPEHRHLSHLYGLHPGNYINIRTTPDLAAAAKQSLLLRGDGGGIGWSTAWKTCFFARLEDSDNAYRQLKKGLKLVDITDKVSMVKGGGTLPNMFNTHPPFQIDGNFGGVAGIAEILLQSQGEEIFLLPAVPAHWPEGKIKGLRAKGGFIVDMYWKDNRLYKVVIVSTLGGNCRVRSSVDFVSANAKIEKAKGKNVNPFYPPIDAPKFLKKKNRKHLLELEIKKTNVIDFQTKAGQTYILLRK